MATSGVLAACVSVDPTMGEREPGVSRIPQADSGPGRRPPHAPSAPGEPGTAAAGPGYPYPPEPATRTSLPRRTRTSRFRGEPRPRLPRRTRDPTPRRRVPATSRRPRIPHEPAGTRYEPSAAYPYGPGGTRTSQAPARVRAAVRVPVRAGAGATRTSPSRPTRTSPSRRDPYEPPPAYARVRPAGGHGSPYRYRCRRTPTSRRRSIRTSRRPVYPYEPPRTGNPYPARPPGPGPGYPYALEAAPGRGAADLRTASRPWLPGRPGSGGPARARGRR